MQTHTAKRVEIVIESDIPLGPAIDDVTAPPTG